MAVQGHEWLRKFGIPWEDGAGNTTIRRPNVWVYNLTLHFFLTSTLFLSVKKKTLPWGGRLTIWWTGQGDTQRDWEGGTTNECVMIQYMPALSMCGCILWRDSLLAVNSVHVPSSVPSLSPYRSLLLGLYRHPAQIAMLLFPRNKKQHLFTEASRIVLPDLLAETRLCNHLCDNREPWYFFVPFPVLELLVLGQIWMQENNKHTESNMIGRHLPNTTPIKVESEKWRCSLKKTTITFL